MYHDLLVRIKNAQMAKKRSLLAPFSKMDFEIAKILVQENYLKEVQKKVFGKKAFLEIKLAYSGGQPAIRGFKFKSLPGRRIYVKAKDIKPVKQGYGLGLISASLGILSDKVAREKGVGGEYLFEIW